MNNTKFRFFLATFGLVVTFTVQFSQGLTNEQDVFAINSLYAELGSPLLPGWVPNGGDPCLLAWQGVQCVESNISSITINGANLRGQLGDGLWNFTSIISMDLSNNNIGGSIPENLPLTLQTFFLSANQFTGNIPSSLSKLTLLSAMSLNANHLSGDLPDALLSLTGFINLDLSSNNLSGQLPPSIEGLSSLTTLHIQNNQFSGTLDVLQDLPLQDLNIENNLFSGPVPEKLLSIPNFKEDGNPFNSTGIAPSSVPSVPPRVLPPPLPFPRTSAPESLPSNSSDGPIPQNSHSGRSRSLSTVKVIGYVLVGVISIIVIVLTVIFCISKFQERKSGNPVTSTRQEVIARERLKEPKSTDQFMKPNTNIKRGRNASEDQNNQLEINIRGSVPMVGPEKKKEHAIDMTRSEELLMPPPPPPPPPHPPPLLPPIEKVIANPIAPPETITRTPSPATVNTPPSVASYSVASLQQYTNSFSEENVIRDGRLGKVFLAELPDGKLLTVMKLDNVNSRISVDDFLELVLSISELRHPNIVELVGYCAEFGQRLLVYNYFSKKTLHDILHYEDDIKRKPSWNGRLQIALGTAKALDLGVVMLELLTGRKPNDSSLPRAEQHLVRWASSQLHDINNLSRMVDPSIGGKCPKKSVSQFADIISRCIQCRVLEQDIT